MLDQLIQNQHLIPFAFLPSHPLNHILSLSQKNLRQLIRFLGLHDLSYEMRKIISTSEMKKIFGGLNKKEGEYLNRLTLQSEPLIFKRFFSLLANTLIKSNSFPASPLQTAQLQFNSKPLFFPKLFFILFKKFHK